jgi:hypothetical protein
MLPLQVFADAWEGAQNDLTACNGEIDEMDEIHALQK